MIDALAAHLPATLVVLAESILVPLAFEVFARRRVARTSRKTSLPPELERFYDGMRRKWAIKAISRD